MDNEEKICRGLKGVSQIESWPKNAPSHADNADQGELGTGATPPGAADIVGEDYGNTFTDSFPFHREDDYDSDASFCVGSDSDDSDGDSSGNNTVDLSRTGGLTRTPGRPSWRRARKVKADGNQDSSGDEGEYDLDLAEESDLSDSYDEDHVDGATPDVTQQFPWKDVGVVDLETASKWDFNTLTKNCKWDVAKEAIERVSSFVGRLRKVEDFRAKILLDPLIPSTDVEKIFLNFDEVLKLQLAVLQEFRKELLKRPFKPRVGRVLRRFAPFLRLHEALACGSGLCRTAIRALSDKNQAFRSAHDRFKSSGYRLDLGDLLFEPYKYIVDCKEQLKKYLKCVIYPEDHEDATDALNKVETVLRVIDEKSMVYYQNNSRMLEIRPIFKRKNIEIMKPHRTLKFEGKMSLISPQTGLPHSCEIFLFNDICALCTPFLAESRWSSVRIVGLRRALVRREDDNVIVIYSPDKVVELQTTEAKVQKLFETMTEVADPPFYNVKDNVVTIDAPLGTRAPRFIPARTVKSCAVCKKAFSSRLRGACHCHACGKVVCVTCCRHTALLPYRAHQGAARRVCDRCWRHLAVQAS